MPTSGQRIVNLIKSGKLGLPEIKEAFADASSSNISVEGWGVCYSSDTRALSEYCTVTSGDADDPITGVGIIAYSSNGATMYCVQYTDGFTSPTVAISVGTALYDQQDGDEALCIVFGRTQGRSFYFSETLAVVACQ